MVPTDPSRMGFQFGTPVAVSAGVTTTTAVPSGSSAGLSAPMMATEGVWYCEMAAETNTATVQPWTYNSVSGNWSKMGPSKNITGSETVLVYTFGARTALQVTAISGTLSTYFQPINKDS